MTKLSCEKISHFSENEFYKRHNKFYLHNSNKLFVYLKNTLIKLIYTKIYMIIKYIITKKFVTKTLCVGQTVVIYLEIKTEFHFQVLKFIEFSVS